MVSGEKKSSMRVLVSFLPSRKITSMPFTSAIFLWMESPVTRTASFSLAHSLIILSISPALALRICHSSGRVPQNLIFIPLSRHKSLNLLSSSRAEKPVDCPMFAWCSTSAIIASGIIISSATSDFRNSTNLPSTITLVSGTYFMVSQSPGFI